MASNNLELTFNAVNGRNNGFNKKENYLKGHSHEIFDPVFFSLNGTPGCPDAWAKAGEI
jgi:hypothetical protein